MPGMKEKMAQLEAHVQRNEAQIQTNKEKNDLRFAFNNYIQRATDNAQDMVNELQDAWVSFSAVMHIKVSKTSEFDLLGALEFAVSFIPMAKVASKIANGIKATSMTASAMEVVTGEDEIDLGVANSVPQFRAAVRKLTNEMDQFTALRREFMKIYPTSTVEQLKTFVLKHIAQPIRRITDKERIKFRYAAEYHLFKAYVTRNVTVGLDKVWVDGKGMVPKYCVLSGLNEKQEAYIYGSFGGGLDGDGARLFRVLFQYWRARMKGDWMSAIREGSRLLLGTRISAVKNAQHLHMVWRARKRDTAFSLRQKEIQQIEKLPDSISKKLTLWYAKNTM